MKKFISSLGLVVLVTIFASCGSDCYTCVDPTGTEPDETLCESDFEGSSEALDVAVALLEAFGSTCTKD